MPRLKPQSARKVPRGEKRRLELAAIAERVFLASGFADTTMQMIASEAGGSKETLYRHFESKESLFAEVVGRRAADISGPDSGFARDEDPETALFELGMSLLRMMTKPDSSALFSLVVADLPRSPALGAIFYDQGPGATLKRLTEYLRVAAERGQLTCRQPLRAARLFLGAVVGQHHLKCLIGGPHIAVSEAEMTDHVGEAVAMFLAHYGSGASKPNTSKPKKKP